MNLEEVMKFKYFTVVGDIHNKNKYAYIIYNKLIENNYIVSSVTKNDSLNNINKIEVINLCINPTLGLKLLKENKNDFKIILIQPNASNQELMDYLNINKIPYLHGCSLEGIRLYKDN